MCNTCYPSGFPSTFVTILFQVYTFIKGCAGAIIMYGCLPLFRSVFMLSGVQYQTFATIASMPWTMKPIIGAVCNNYPLFGYKKRNYILVSVIVGTIASGTLTLDSDVTVTTALLFTVSLSIVVIDLIYEGEYSSIMAFKDGSTSMPSFVWSCVMIGSVIGAVLVGPLGDEGKIRYVYPVAALCMFQLLYSILYHPDQSFEHDRVVFKKNAHVELSESIIEKPPLQESPVVITRIHRNEWILCIMMAMLSVILIVFLVSGVEYAWSTLGFATVGVIILHGWAYYTYHTNSSSVVNKKRRHQLWVFNLYMFLVEAFYINISGAQDYWFTADPACVPNGPHFSLTLYTSTVTIISAVAGIFASVLYTKTLMHWTFRNALQMAIMFQAMSSITDIAIAKRWNQSHLHMSDEFFFIMGDAVISPVASMLKLIPMAVLTSTIVEKGKEVMTYSLLAGFQNLGLVFAKIFGLALIQSFNIQTTTPYCNFDYYPALIFFSHIIMPSLAFVLAFIMLPSAYQYKSIY